MALNGTLYIGIMVAWRVRSKDLALFLFEVIFLDTKRVLQKHGMEASTAGIYSPKAGCRWWAL
jgi:hypothetical protein